MIRHLLAAETHPMQGNQSCTAARLLVSVRDADEAELAKRLGVQWIDLKNPDAGSLGAAPLAVARAVANILHSGDAKSPELMSAAAGELRDRPLQTALELAQLFPLVKVGLSGMAKRANWQSQLRDLALQLSAAGSQLVPVIYADHQQSDAPTPSEVLSASAELPPACHDRPPTRFVLIDTYTKDGRRLLDWQAPTQLSEICLQARAAGRHIVLAGSLAVVDLPQLLPLAPAAVAVRGAVCAQDRRSSLCPQKVSQWLQLVQTQ